MRSVIGVTTISFVAFLTHAHVSEDSTHESVNKLADEVLDSLFDRALLARPSYDADLDKTSLAKPGHLGVPRHKNSIVKEQYDYIIVGAGAAGSLLARRLGDAGKKVLVLEKGTETGGLMKTIPASVVKLFMNPRYDYMLTSEKEKHLDGRGVYLIRGKMLGGSSSCNVLIYHRGTARDYDVHWPKGWKSWDNLPFFKKFERYKSKIVGGNSRFHGYDGDLTVEDVNYQNKLSNAFIDSAVQFGAKRNNNFNDWSHEQAGVGKFQVTTKNGRRQDGYTAFLKDAPKQVTLLTGVSVNTIIFNPDKVATGVAFEDKNGNTHIANVKEGGEVILSAGAIMTPEILMASGIGPKEKLAKVGIQTVVNLPGVGQNLQDQPGVSLQYNVAKNLSITDQMFIRKTAKVNPIAVLNWKMEGKGPLTSPGCEQGAFFKTREGLEDPDLQVRFVPARGTSPDAVKTYTNLGKVPPAQSGIAMQIIAVRPESTGSVGLRDGKVSNKPVINTNYLDSPDDRRTLRDGLRLVRQVVAQSSLQEHVLDEVWPGKDVQSDKELDRYIKETVHSTNALVGTCKMGNPEDKYAVVDTSLRVFGAKHLRVVDASVFPKVPGGQTAAPTYMVAERAADIILREADAVKAEAAAASGSRGKADYQKAKAAAAKDIYKKIFLEADAQR